MADPVITAPTAPVTTEPAAPVETFAEKMERLGGFGDDSEPEAPAIAANDAGEAPPPANDTKAKPKGKKVVTPGGDRMAELQAIAKELNLEVVAGKVLPSDRVKFSEWKRKQTEQLAATERERLGKLEEREKAAEARLKKTDAIEKAYEAGDYDSLAKALGADDWNKLQEDVIARISDPNYKRLRELERFKAEQTEREEKTRAEMEARQAQQVRQQAVAKYMGDLAVEIKSSKDPLLQALHDEPNFVQAIYRIQQEQWDGTSTVKPEQALKMAMKGANRSIHSELHALYTKLHKVFGSAPANSNGTAPRKPAPRSAPVPPSRGAEAGGTKPVGQMSKTEYQDYFRRRMEEASEADRKL